jgi:AcrR family transcriptional regulator
MKRSAATPASPASITGLRPFVPPPAPRTPKSAGTRRLLLDVAARLFVERGYNAVSMRDVASAAQLTKGAVYGHFRSKGQLLVEVIRWKIAEQDDATDYVALSPYPERTIELIYDEAAAGIRVLEVDAAAAARHDPDVAAGLKAFYEERHDRIREAMGWVEDPDTAAWLVEALTAGIGMKLSSGLPLPDTARLNAAIQAALLGLS